LDDAVAGVLGEDMARSEVFHFVGLGVPSAFAPSPSKFGGAGASVVALDQLRRSTRHVCQLL
jgi:hypothetical protein